MLANNKRLFPCFFTALRIMCMYNDSFKMRDDTPEASDAFDAIEYTIEIVDQHKEICYSKLTN